MNKQYVHKQVCILKNKDTYMQCNGMEQRKRVMKNGEGNAENGFHRSHFHRSCCKGLGGLTFWCESILLNVNPSGQ